MPSEGYVNNIGFLNHVLSRTSTTTPFLIPQEPYEGESFFCDRIIYYGKCNLLCVTGLVSLAPLATPLPPPPPLPTTHLKVTAHHFLDVIGKYDSDFS